MQEDLRQQIALFRYAVISELVSQPLAPGQKEQRLAQLAAKPWAIPGTHRTTVGRSTVREWVEQYKALGFDGLKPCPRADAGKPRALAEPVQDLLLALRAERPRASIDSLIKAVHLCGRVDSSLRLSRSTVGRFFAAQGPKALPATAVTAEPDAVAFTYPHANDLWTSDLMHGPRLLLPGRRNDKTYLYAFLDDASRMVPFAAFYTAENAACFQDAFKQALLRRGIPRRLYCDNGATFRTDHLRVLCATLNLALIHSRPHRPRGRGKIERFFRHVRSAFLPHLTPQSLTDLGALNRLFWAWLEAEYHQTPHGGLDGQTPLDRFLLDEALLRQAPDELDRLLRMKVPRRVARDRTVHLNARLYEAPDGYAGETVDILYDPYDPTRPVHLRRRGQTAEIPLRRLDLHANASRPRLPREAGSDEPVAPTTGISYLDLIAQRFYGEPKP